MAAPGDRLPSIAVEGLYPSVDGGRFPAKRTEGETLEVWADIFKPGHDSVLGALEVRGPQGIWRELPMGPYDNDRWVGSARLDAVGGWAYRVSAWTDVYGTGLRGLEKWVAAGEDVSSDLASLVSLVEDAASRAERNDGEALLAYIRRANPGADPAKAVRVMSDEPVLALMRKYGRRGDRTWSPEFSVVVDRREGVFAAWYEMFHRSQGKVPHRGATFRDCIERLPDVASMGFDVVYLPPIHPIGKTNRRGPENTPEAGPEAPGSPWAIGSEEGGHDAVNPDLGTMADFQDFVGAAKKLGMEVALDLAFQCSPDHPYVENHPEWFYHRRDGSIRYAENPPKKYFDIYPLAFDNENWKELWEELRRVTLFWVSKGVRTFRVDNPHTKPSGFWEWLISEVKKEHPDVLFLAEAFTAPKPMKWLSKLGFSESYTYFTWKNTKKELEEFLSEFVLSDASEYYRGNFFTNTPDILHSYLQRGGRPAFKIRLALAATLSSLYGIYNGFELCENIPKEEGSEEYKHSEKYEYKVRDWNAPGNIKDYISAINRIRRENPALQSTKNLRLLGAENESVMFYAKWTEDRSNVVAAAVSLDPLSPQRSKVHFPAELFGLGEGGTYAMRELITGSVYEWRGNTAEVNLDPAAEPARIFRLER